MSAAGRPVPEAEPSLPLVPEFARTRASVAARVRTRPRTVHARAGRRPLRHHGTGPGPLAGPLACPLRGAAVVLREGPGTGPGAGPDAGGACRREAETAVP